jgi:hypothetical protein
MMLPFLPLLGATATDEAEDHEEPGQLPAPSLMA